MSVQPEDDSVWDPIPDVIERENAILAGNFVQCSVYRSVSKGSWIDVEGKTSLAKAQGVKPATSREIQRPVGPFRKTGFADKVDQGSALVAKREDSHALLDPHAI